MLVEGEEDGVVLQGNGCDPKIVYGDGSSIPAQVGIQPGVDITGVFVGTSDRNPIGIEKALEDLFIFIASFSHGETCPKLGNDHEWENDLVGSLNGSDRHPLVFAECRVGAGVDRQPHFQSPGSIFSNAFRALSNALSVFQDPANSSRS